MLRNGRSVRTLLGSSELSPLPLPLLLATLETRCISIRSRWKQSMVMC